MLQNYINSFKLQKKEYKNSLYPSANVKKSLFLKIIVSKYCYNKKLLYLCNTIKHRIFNLKLYRYERKRITKRINRRKRFL